MFGILGKFYPMSGGSPQLPEDPSPMPTMGSDDEESFVLLCNSYAPELDLTFKDLDIEPVQSGPIEEGKKLITMELSQLENSSLPDVPQETMKTSEPKSTVTSILSEKSREELSDMIEHLLTRNIYFKDTLTANYAAMEAQYKKIMEWKEEVYNTYQDHKKKFADAKEFIAKLKSEKDILTFELEKSKEIRGMEQAELLRLKAELAEKVCLPKNCDTAGSSRDNVTKDQDLAHTSRLYEDMNKKLDQCEKWLKLSDLRHARLTSENEELKEKLSSLENNEETVAELEEEVEKKDEIIEMLEQKLLQREQSSAYDMNNLRDQISKLETQLSSAAHLQEDLNNLRKQLMSAQASITSLHQMNGSLVAQLSVEKRRVQELTELESIRDDYLVLQQQLQVYKADFDTEKNTKDALQAEKEQIIQDFLQLQKRNSELNDELAIMRENGFVLTGTELSNQGSTSNTSSARPQQLKKFYYCPVCQFGFQGLTALENHVDRCMELTSSF
ncbi:hypothetical protein WA026_011765 [Henosepilachna vigintioctopunctata]|uniref:Optineurin n=1 Tax=Henosepilachna vigintioctopunctata TaxID=420089 RepID=A0AAW1UA60_9CUCU